MKDFSAGDRANIEFVIDGDIFLAASDCPGGVIADLADVIEATTDAAKLRGVMGFMDQVLLPESADLFADRLRSTEKPISFNQAVDVFEWLIGQYTGEMVPTQAASSSSSGRSSTSRSSTRQRRSTSTLELPASDAV